MIEIWKSAYGKLKSNAGESIGETLVALLISALALVMLAGAISATARMITVSDRQIGRYYEGDAKLVNQTEKDRENSLLTVTITGSASKTPEIHNDVKWYLNDAFSSKPVVAYKLPLST